MRTLAFIVLAVAVPVGALAQPLPTSRAFEPVVVTGAVIEPLAGATPERIAAFRYEGGAWAQVPVQVDEREKIDLVWVYNGRDNIRCETTDWCVQRDPVYETVYMDEGTYVGPDGDPFVDADDEVVFMAQDAGARAPADAEAPPGALGAHGVEVEVAAPGGERGYVYLFWNDGRYPGDAGRPYVGYRFRLLSGGYLATYNPRAVAYDKYNPVGDDLGANPEDSEVETAFYRRHFSDRWIEDGLQIRVGATPEADLVDRWKIQFDPGRCVRTEYTGSSGKGAFIATRTGPVRAIRSVIGFNSGPYMQQDAFYYERYVATTFYFRGHPLDSGPLGYYDYSSAAVGMRRWSNLNPAEDSFLFDGVPEEIAAGPLEWEVVQGTQGTLVSVYGLTTDIPGLERSSYYNDEAPATITQCTGDASSYGASGLRVWGPLPNTDPARGEANSLVMYRHQLIEGPAFGEAAAFVEAAQNPLAVTAAPYPVRLGVDPHPGPEGPVFLGVPRPNPASEVARVMYWLEAETDVRLSVYDLAGRRVAVLDEGLRPQGYHDVALGPDRFSFGTYLVVLETPLGERTVTFVKP